MPDIRERIAKRKKEKIGKKGKVVLGEFGKGKLRTSAGKPVTDISQAVAIAFSEQRAAKKRGSAIRTFMGRARLRPKLKG